MPRRTNKFQELIAFIIFTTKGLNYLVEESVLEINKKTGLIREIDIKITQKANPNNKTLVECRDHKRKQDVTWIDNLDGKARSLGFSKVIAVSSSGFSKTAILEAKERNIETLTLDEAWNIEWKEWFLFLKQITVNKISLPRITSIFIYNKNNKKVAITDPLNTRFIKVENKEWCTVLNFIKSHTEEILNDFENKRIPNQGTKIIYEVPLTNFLFQFKGSKNTYNAMKLELHILEYNDVFSLPLKPFILGSEKLFIGNKNLSNSKFNMIVNLKNDHDVQIGIKEQILNRPKTLVRQ